MTGENNSGFLRDPQKTFSSSKPKQRNTSLIVSIVVLVIVIAGYFGLTMYKASLDDSIAKIDLELQNIEAQRDKEKENRIFIFSEQLDLAGNLLQEHVVWSDAFKTIQDFLQPTVRATSLTADFEEGKMVLNLEADSYTTVAKQIASFYANDAIEDVGVDALKSESTGEVSFNMEIKFDPKTLLIKQ
ncbi:MAG: hypothetical protein ABH833_02200 [Parcubacteria group bacterium]